MTPERLLRLGLATIAVAGVLTAAAAIAGLGAWALLPLMFAIVCSMGLIMSNSIAVSMALESYRAGSAAALFGASQFFIGAAVAPIVGAAGASAVPMGIVMATVRRRRAGDRPDDYTRARLDAGAVAQPARTRRRKRHGLDPRHDLIGQRADALDRQRHDVAGRQRRPLLSATP